MTCTAGSWRTPSRDPGYEAGTAGTVNYVVAVNVEGQAPHTFVKTFADGTDDSGGTCFPTPPDTTPLCGVLIDTFKVP